MRFEVQANAATDWWDTVVEWFGTASEVVVSSIGIIIGGIVVYFIGSLLIRGLVRGIKRSADSEDRARKWLRRAKVEVPEPTLEEELADERLQQRARTIGVVLRSTLAVIVVITTVMMILSQLGLSVAPLLASAGIVGVALGFGAQSLVKDIIAGMFMLIEDQFGVGDVIDAGEAKGAVEFVGLRATRLRSLDGTVWFIPNGSIVRVGNMTRIWSRALVEVRVDIRENVEEARAAMLDATRAAIADPEVAPAVLGDPEIPGVESLQSDAFMLRVLVQVQPAQQWNVMRAIRNSIRTEFAERGIRLAAPDNRLYTSYDDTAVSRRSKGAASVVDSGPDADKGKGKRK